VVSAERYNAEEGRVFTREYLHRLAASPEVEAAGFINNIHMNTTSTQTIEVNVDGIDPPQGRPGWEVDQAVAVPEFFEAAGIPILRGRNFQDTDIEDGPGVVIVNEVMAERFWPGEDALGKTIRRPGGQEYTVVGIARTTKVRTLGEAPRPFIYRPYSQNYVTFLTAVVRSPGRAEEGLQAAFRVLREQDPDILVAETKTMDEHLGVMLFPARMGSILSSLFALIALALATIGLYGIVSFSVSRKSREVGIRMSLGAEPGRVVREIIREGMGLVLAGAGAGLLLSLALAQVLQSLLYGVSALDPITFMVVPTGLLGVAFLAAYLPARKASRVDPVRALKAE
jgi:predicted permease